ncbi:hypothetical protein CMI47_23325 [Candidatus Pacearchaeota archaeon]|jgi:hypothetical protein|nr:hypothetical protein [Candidatus Pacearchaeota archaeon]|tara:strand:+ start:1985 stop:2434 length:450 start_codon:yes stop_codon:yes gene_type:complete
MRLIAHRGNINGSHAQLENDPSYIIAALQKGYDVEVDVWYKNTQWFLGHDKPLFPVSIEFLKTEGLWCHAKNLQALENMLYTNINCFWHQHDYYTLTSSGIIWTYPTRPICKQSIIVCHTLEETVKMSTQNIWGICSDYVEKIENVCRI